MPFADLKVIRSTALISGRSVTVYRPVKPIRRLYVGARSDGGYPTLCHDLAAIGQIAAFSALAEQAKDSVIWIPKSGDRTNWEFGQQFPICDLVMSHHSLQLKPASWKAARAQAGKGGSEQTMSVLLPDKAEEQFRRQSKVPPRFSLDAVEDHREDLADLALHSNTIFLAGSRVVFHWLTELMLWQKENALRTGADVETCPFSRTPKQQGADGFLRVVYYQPKDWLDPAKPDR